MAKEKAWMRMYDDYTEQKIGRGAFLGFKKTYEREVEELEGQLDLLKDKQLAEALRREAGDMEKYGRWLPYFFAVKRSLSEAPFR